MENQKNERRQSARPRSAPKSSVDAGDYASRPPGDSRRVPMGEFVPRMVDVVTLELASTDYRGSRYVANRAGEINAVVLIPDGRYRTTKFIQIGISLEVK